MIANALDDRKKTGMATGRKTFRKAACVALKAKRPEASRPKKAVRRSPEPDFPDYGDSAEHLKSGAESPHITSQA